MLELLPDHVPGWLVPAAIAAFIIGVLLVAIGLGRLALGVLWERGRIPEFRRATGRHHRRPVEPVIGSRRAHVPMASPPAESVGGEARRATSGPPLVTEASSRH